MSKFSLNDMKSLRRQKYGMMAGIEWFEKSRKSIRAVTSGNATGATGSQ